MVHDILSAPIERSCGRQSQLSGCVGGAGLDALRTSNGHVPMPLMVRLFIRILDSFGRVTIV